MHNRLLTPLGAWTQQLCHQSWFWFIEPNSLALWKLHQTTGTPTWEAHLPILQPNRWSTRAAQSPIYGLANSTEHNISPGNLSPATLNHDRYTNLTTIIRGPSLPPIAQLATTDMQTNTERFRSALTKPYLSFTLTYQHHLQVGILQDKPS